VSPETRARAAIRLGSWLATNQGQGELQLRNGRALRIEHEWPEPRWTVTRPGRDRPIAQGNFETLLDTVLREGARPTSGTV
jgi:hypothetical protein